MSTNEEVRVLVSIVLLELVPELEVIVESIVGGTSSTFGGDSLRGGLQKVSGKCPQLSDS